MIKNKKIAITMGDPAGIGSEIIIKALNSLGYKSEDYLLIGNKDIFYKTAADIKQNLDKNIEIIDIPCDISKINIGEPGIESGKLSFKALEMACQLANDKEINAIVTAPVSKKAINMAGYHYSGQTEILQKYLKNNISNAQAEMLFVSRDFRVLLLTRHVKLTEVSKRLNIDNIINSICALNKSLRKDFGVKNPVMAICSLNPHAGEDGLLGSEEQEIIIPALNRLKDSFKINIEGPFPSDTMWLKAAKPCFESRQQPYDAYIACYHDQGLIPVKLLAMDSAVNITINLSVIRTSPCHGTAYDIAGKNTANPNSMKAAIQQAYTILNMI